MVRSSGILLPITSIPSPYGIGTFGRKAYEFIDFLHDAGQTWWQRCRRVFSIDADENENAA